MNSLLKKILTPQAAYSAIDFDFLSYGLKRVARAQLEQDSALEALAKI